MNPSLTAALAGALLHFLWQGALLAIGVALTVAVTRDARIRYAAACLALFTMPLAFVVTVAVAYPHPASSALRERLSQPLAPALGSGLWKQPAASPLAALESLMKGFVPVWFAGIALLYLRGVMSWIEVRRIRRNAVAPVAPEWIARLGELTSRLGIARGVAFLESRIVDVPVVAGILRPVILVPAGCFANLPAEQIEYLLIHELAHVRRFDYLVNLIQRAVEGLLFYHPAVWWVSNV
ncbi:MAG: M56 family metallopeptidase, partial [Acidobacteriota bacterium]|nr:M56 family metallopeptidase [Acidobacteriota bacterium]